MGKWHGAEIDITGKDKAAVLAALYNGCVGCRRKIDTQEALKLLEMSNSKIAYIDGLTLKINLTGDKFWPVLYDQANGGEGTARKVLERVGLL